MDVTSPPTCALPPVMLVAAELVIVGSAKASVVKVSLVGAQSLPETLVARAR